MACIKIALDMGIFNALTERSGTPISAVELAEKCGADTLLVGTLPLRY